MHKIFPIDSEGRIRIIPIGYVRATQKPDPDRPLQDTEAEVVLDNDFNRFLDGLEEFSHINVICWLSKITSFRENCRPQDREDVPLVGQLATR